MNADSFFVIGTTHKICQDYALCRSHESKPYALLSDGCSSAEHSDFGSRLLVKSAERYLRVDYSGDIASYLFNSVLSAQSVAAGLQLHNDSLCATLLTAKLDKGCIQTICVGDGLIAARTPDGTVIVHEYRFESGAPYYLRYELEDETKKGYFEKFGKKGTHRTYSIDPKGQVTGPFELPFLFDEDLIYFEERFPIEEYESVSLFSDGSSAFLQQSKSTTSRQNHVVDSAVIVKEFTAFKGYVGEFCQRRSIKAMKTLAEQGIHNSDDLSIAVLAKI